MYDDVVVIGGEISLNILADGDSSLSLSEDGIEGTVIAYEQHAREPYTGSYVFTPSSETQTIQIADKVPSRDITINPIPSNYGLVTWNGSSLTIS